MQGQLMLEDMWSKNGTFLNGRKLKPGEVAALKKGDVVKIGQEEITVSRAEVAEGTGTARPGAPTEARFTCGGSSGAGVEGASEGKSVAHFEGALAIAGCVFENKLPYTVTQAGGKVSGSWGNMRKVRPVKITPNDIQDITAPLTQEGRLEAAQKVFYFEGLVRETAPGDYAAVDPKEFLGFALTQFSEGQSMHVINIVGNEPVMWTYTWPSKSKYRLAIFDDYLRLPGFDRVIEPYVAELQGTEKYVKGTHRQPADAAEFKAALEAEPGAKSALIKNIAKADLTPSQVQVRYQDGVLGPLTDVIPDVKPEDPVFVLENDFANLRPGQTPSLQVHVDDGTGSHKHVPDPEAAMEAINDSTLGPQILGHINDERIMIEDVVVRYADGSTGSLADILPAYKNAEGFEELRSSGIYVTEGNPGKWGTLKSPETAPLWGGFAQKDKAIVDAFEKPTFSLNWKGNVGKDMAYVRKTGDQEFDLVTTHQEQSLSPFTQFTKDLLGKIRRDPVLPLRKYFDDITKLDGRQFAEQMKTFAADGKTRSVILSPTKRGIFTGYDAHLEMEIVTEGGAQKMKVTGVSGPLDTSKYAAADSADIANFGSGLPAEYDFAAYGR